MLTKCFNITAIVVLLGTVLSQNPTPLLAGTAQDAIKKAKEELAKQLKKKDGAAKQQQANGDTQTSEADDAEASRSPIRPLVQGATTLFSMGFANSEEESFPPELIPLRGNMIVREIDGERYLICEEQFAFVIPLENKISGAFAIEIEVFHDLKNALVRPSDNRGFALSMAKEIPASDKWFHYETSNKAYLNTSSAELLYREGENGYNAKGSIKIVNGSMKIREKAISYPISLFLGSDGFNTVAGWDEMSLVVQASTQTRFDSLSRYVVIQSYSPLWIKHIRVTSLSPEQRATVKLLYHPQRGSEEDSQTSEDGVLYQERFESTPVGAFPIRSDLFFKGDCGWVVENSGSHMLAGPSQLFLRLRQPLPQRYSLEFDLLFQSSEFTAVTTEFSAIPGFSDSLRTTFQRDQTKFPRELKCMPLAAVIGPRGSKLGREVVARENSGVEVGKITHFTILVDNKKVQLQKDGKIVSSSIEGCNFGRDFIEMRFPGNPEAPVLIDNMVIRLIDPTEKR